MTPIENPEVAAVFERYPAPMRDNLLFLRQLVYDTAAETPDAGPVEESLKWGEPSYVTKRGSAVRMAWKPDAPQQYAMYFHCRTTLVETFRELYGESFTFEGNRAIVFENSAEVPVDALKHCISLALTYHKRKHLPLLGA